MCLTDSRLVAGATPHFLNSKKAHWSCDWEESYESAPEAEMQIMTHLPEPERDRTLWDPR